MRTFAASNGVDVAAGDGVGEAVDCALAIGDGDGVVGGGAPLVPGGEPVTMGTVEAACEQATSAEKTTMAASRRHIVIIVCPNKNKSLTA
jgi:hypothetical protein